MKENILINPYEELINCTDFDRVDDILDEMGMATCIKKRTLLINGITGLRYVYYTHPKEEMSDEDFYKEAKSALVDQVWKNFK